MANSITLAKNYIGLLDEVYRQASVTADLISDPALVRAGAQANEILVPKYSMDGLKDYSRNDGYKKGSVTVQWETLKFEYDRGIKFEVDTQDNAESLNIAFGALNAKFIKDRVAPESDAYTFSKIAQASDILTGAEKTLATGEEVLAELVNATTEMDEAEVPYENRILYITPTLYLMAKSVKLDVNQAIFDRFSAIKTPAQSRFYTKIDLTADGNGGYTKNDGGKAINFMIVHKDAVIKHLKHVANDIIPANLNPDSDANILKYRAYGITSVFENKTKGIYLSNKGE